MSEVALRTLPPGISQEVLVQLLEGMHNREALLQRVIQRFEQRYNSSLEVLENRLAQGEGSEHPDWEDSIEWRNAVEALHSAQILRSLLEWLLHLTSPSLAS